MGSDNRKKIRVLHTDYTERKVPVYWLQSTEKIK